MSASETAQKWLLASIPFFRTLSFFELYRELSDDALVATLDKLSGGSLIRHVDWVLAHSRNAESAETWIESTMAEISTVK